MEKYLHQEKSDCLKVVLFGPESTGKSSLAKELADYYDTNFVPEYARDYLQDKWDKYNKLCELDDLIPIAMGQIKSENKFSRTANKILFCDTDLLTTATYSKLYFDGYCNPILEKSLMTHNYDLYLLMDIDISWVKDDLRDRPKHRKLFYSAFKNALLKNRRKFKIISGSFKKRKETSIDYINKSLNLQ